MATTLASTPATGPTKPPANAQADGPAKPPTITIDHTTGDPKYPTPQEYKSPGSVLQIRKSMDLVLLAYPLDPAKLNRFQDFYKNNIQSWMRDRGVGHAHAYLVGSNLVVLASTPADVPWIYGTNPINGLKDFLATEQPLKIIKLPVLSNPAGE